MRGKVAKALRKQARAMTEGQPDKDYTTHSVVKKMLTHPQSQYKGAAINVRKDTIALIPSCTRFIYKALKGAHYARRSL